MRRFSNLSMKERDAAEKAAIASEKARADHHRVRAEAFAGSLGPQCFADGPCWYTAGQFNVRNRAEDFSPVEGLYQLTSTGAIFRWKSTGLGGWEAVEGWGPVEGYALPPLVTVPVV